MAAVTPIEISVSMLAVPRRALRRAVLWNGQAAQVTTGAASAVSTHCQPANRVSGTTANITDRSASGTNRTAATASRTSRLRAYRASGSSSVSVACRRGCAG